MEQKYRQLSLSNLALTIGVILYALLFYYYGRENLYFGFAVVLGLISFPFLIQRTEGKLEYGYLIAAMVFAIGAFCSGSFSLFYATFVFGLYFLLSLGLGRLNVLPLVLLFLISPLVSHVTSMFSFPIRLQLSHWVSHVLSVAGIEIFSEGNLLILAGERFLVDQECVGLKMLITGLVITLVLLAYQERKYKYSTTAKQIFIVMTISFMFNILANFSRILVLVLFKIGPDHPLHEIVGVFCLLLYNLTPLVFLVRFFKPKVMEQELELPRLQSYKSRIIWIPILILCLSLAGHALNRDDGLISANVRSSILDSLDKEELDNKVIKYSNEDLLVYIKPPVSPIRGTHDPKFCWRGSGYAPKLIKQTVFQGQAIYTGELVKGKDKLYTAWWYQDGKSITNSEWTWRTKGIFDSKSYALINISANSQNNLKQAIEDYFTELYGVE